MRAQLQCNPTQRLYHFLEGKVTDCQLALASAFVRHVLGTMKLILMDASERHVAVCCSNAMTIAVKPECYLTQEGLLSVSLTLMPVI